MAEKIRKVVEIEVDVNSSEVTQLNTQIKTTNSSLNQINGSTAGLENQFNQTTSGAVSGFKKLRKAIQEAGKRVKGVSKDFKKNEKGTSRLARGFSKIGTAIKAAFNPVLEKFDQLTKKSKQINSELSETTDCKKTDSLKNCVSDLNDEFGETSEKVKSVDKKVESVDKNLKKTEKGTGLLSGGFKKVGTAIKGAGIGLLLSALATVVQMFKSNQKAIDAFETGLTALKIAANDLFKFFESNVGTVVDYFNQLFEDPQKKIEELGALMREGLTKRFEQFMETLGLAGKALFQFFAGDFEKAWETAKEAAVQSVDVITGEDGGLEKIVNTAKKAVGAISDYTSETLKSAKASVELSKAAELAAIQQQGVIEEYDRAAELLRQNRDDETKSFEERIAANEKLGEILKDQIEAETALIDIQQRAILDRLAKGLIPEFEAKKQLLELENERAAVLSKVTGFESEQLTNRNSLLREQRDLQDQITQQAIDRQKQLDDISLEIMQEGIDKELMMSAQKYDALYAQAEGNAELQNQITEAQEREDQAIRDKYDAERKAAEDKARADQIALEREKQQQLEQLATDGLQAVSAATEFFLSKSKVNAKRQFQITKSLQLSLAIIDGIKAVTASLAASPVAIGPAPNPAGIASLAFAVLSSAVAVAKIASAKYEPSGGGGGGGGARPSAPSIPSAGGGGTPQFNTVGTSGFNQVAGSIAQQNQEPVKAYVVSTDVTSQQSLDRNSREKSSF